MTVVTDRRAEHPVTVLLAEPGEDSELKAIAYIGSVLNEFDNATRERILSYLCRRHNLSQ